MNNYYDRHGNPISREEGIALLGGMAKRRVAHHVLRGGGIATGHEVRISTVHLVLDHSLDNVGPPIIFETMVFGPGADIRDGWTSRYATEEVALEGHAATVASLRLIFNPDSEFGRTTPWTPSPIIEEDVL